jgi:hypothetical protein
LGCAARSCERGERKERRRGRGDTPYSSDGVVEKATSGIGFFEGEFSGLEMSLKDTKRFKPEAKGWGYFSFRHKYPLKKQTAENAFTSCAQCHVDNAASDMVFTLYYQQTVGALKDPKSFSALLL